ncbi:putative membrane protein [Mesocricetibacter intestinalis]|uniref:Putative membrane protein n=2 Tax=Mesocricetibacter intestinalis TaxID=1521930 RepID=A0A4R6VC70_9PAST|nr:PACE efflux transporter [Mesocricetibacter intestinalis]TDQ59506.1 putative membrane protein [Mesocricetibacter intestinalis]
MHTKERIFHAALFELILIVLSVIGLAWLTEHDSRDLLHMTVIISLIAMLWNFIFNWIFDRFFTGARENRRLTLRLFHAVAFEGGLLIFTIPFIAYMLQVDWLTAFVMDIGLTLAVLVYTVIFNWIYDHLRLKFIAAVPCSSR